MSTAGRRTRDSFEEAADAFASLEREMEEVADKSLFAIAEEIITESKARRVPVDKGPLRASGHVERRDENEVVAGFGGVAGTGNVDGDSNREDVGYAVVQHERVDFSHEVGEARYLIRSVEAWRADGSAAMKALRFNTAQAIARAGSITAGGSFPGAPRL